MDDKYKITIYHSFLDDGSLTLAVSNYMYINIKSKLYCMKKGGSFRFDFYFTDLLEDENT